MSEKKGASISTKQFQIKLFVNDQLTDWRDDVNKEEKSNVIKNWVKVYGDKGNKVHVDISQGLKSKAPKVVAKKKKEPVILKSFFYRPKSQYSNLRLYDQLNDD